MLTVQENQFGEVEEKMNKALFEVSVLAPSLSNLESAKRELTEALRLTRHMRRIGEEMVVIPYFDTEAQKGALDHHRRAEQARVVNPVGG